MKRKKLDLAHEAHVGHISLFVFTAEEHEASGIGGVGDYYDGDCHAIGSDERVCSVNSYQEAGRE